MESSKQKDKKPSISKLAKAAIKSEHNFPSETYLIVSTKWKKALSNNYAVIDALGITIYTYDDNRTIKLLKEEFYPWTLWSNVKIDHYFVKSIFSFTGKEPLTFIPTESGQDVEAFIKKFTDIKVHVITRKWYNKIIGYRSKKKWKMITASLIYVLLLGSCANAFSQDDANNSAGEKDKVKTESVRSDTNIDNKNKNNDNIDNEKTTNEKDKPSTNTSVVTSSKPKNHTKTSDSKEKVPVTLAETVDGDTIKVNYKGKEETVRYLLVDTPESKKPGTCVQPFAKDAAERNRQLVNSGKLTLEFEKSRTDKYGRLLAYVFVDGKSVQETLLKEGYARVAYVYEPPYKYLSTYEKAEDSAQVKHLRIWSRSGFVTNRGFVGCVAKVVKTQPAKPKVHTTPKPKPEPVQTNFANCTDLRRVYPNGVPSSHPAYQPKMDRDHDNYACERN